MTMRYEGSSRCAQAPFGRGMALLEHASVVDARTPPLDLFNNEVGRLIASGNPGATFGELAQLCLTAFSNGEFTVLNPDSPA